MRVNGATKPATGRLFRQLGIFGLDRIEHAIVAGVVTGDPILLIGSHGTAKTTLCRRLAEALGLRFWAYDASKSLFEDILGFPNPASLTSGRIDYVPTPISIWDKQAVLIDELSRAAPSMQNKWLEVIRSRQIMGRKVEGLEVVFAAMNPASYIGAQPLDEALAGRFAVIAIVPEVRDMEDEDVLRVVSNVTEDDAPGLARDMEQSGTELRSFVEDARRAVADLDADVKKKLASYTLELARFLEKRDAPLDGRRLGMLYRTLQAYLVVAGSERDLDGKLLYAALESLLPFAATGRELPLPVLRAAHDAALAAASGSKRVRGVRLPRDPVAAVYAFEEQAAHVDPQERRATVTHFLAQARVQQGHEKRAPALAALALLASKVMKGALRLAPDEQFQILETFARASTIPPEQLTDALYSLNNTTNSERAHDLGAPATNAALRLGFVGAATNGAPDAKELARLADLIAHTLEGGERR